MSEIVSLKLGEDHPSKGDPPFPSVHLNELNRALESKKSCELLSSITKVS